MDIKDILLPIRPGDNSGAAAIAAAMARDLGACVQGVCLPPLPSLQPSDCYAIGATAVSDVLRRMDDEEAGVEAVVQSVFEAAMDAAGCEREWRGAEPGELAAQTALRARLADLSIMPRPAAHDAIGQQLAETLVRMGGSPCLLIPDRGPPPYPFKHVVVAWNGSRGAKRAMDDAMPLLRRAETVQALVVGDPDGREPNRPGLKRHLARHGVKADILALPVGRGGAAAALIAYCGDHAADLLVMGAFGHSPRAEQWLGGTTWTVLTTVSTPVFMSA